MSKIQTLDEMLREQRKNLRANSDVAVEDAKSDAKPVGAKAQQTPLISRLDKNLTTASTANSTTLPTASRPFAQTPARSGVSSGTSQSKPELFRRPGDGYLSEKPVKKRTDYVDIREFKLERKRRAQEAVTPLAPTSESARRVFSFEEIKARAQMAQNQSAAKPAPAPAVAPKPAPVPVKKTTVKKKAAPKKKKVDADLLKKKKKAFFDDLN